MAIRKVIKYGDPILNTKLKKTDFKTIEAQLPALLQDMEETCLAVNGAGLAANQIGLTHRLALILIPEPKPKASNGADAPLQGETRFKRYVIINPEIVETKGRIVDDEGCLSLPGLFVEIERAQTVKVRALNEKGQLVEIHATGLLAKALQHEIDHLDGKVFIEHADPSLKPAIKKEIKRLKKEWDK
ncbi:peptide deformylase [Elusimicrobium posterum]|uniref:peptide deformylase n=1 Tax=Elusimicrobium posterum TaxID=3116653 RepID=UPI003C739CB1